jgi:hypothetical protein
MTAKSPRPKRRWLRVVLIVFAVIVFLFLLLPFAPELVVCVSVGWLLLTGWIHFLARVGGELQFNTEIAFDAILALVLAIFGLHRIFRWWQQKLTNDAPTKWKLRWTLQITAMGLFLFAASISAVGIVHQIGWLFRADHLVYNAGFGFQTKQLSDLKQVALALRLYAEDHKNTLPPQLEQLIPDYLTSHQFFFAAPARDEPLERISYFRGDGKFVYQENDEHILVAGPLLKSTRGDMRVFICRNCSGRVAKETDFQSRMAKQKE